MPLYNPPSQSEGGASVADVPLEDPGNTWEANTAVTQGYRIAETVQGVLRVFEAVTAGTTANLGGFTELDPHIAPLGLTTDGDDPFFNWRYLGPVGQISWELSPTQPEVQVVKDGNSGRCFIRLIHKTAPPADSRQLLQVMATVEGEQVAIFEIKTDGDADFMLDENTGAGFRFNNAIDGVVTETVSKTEITTTGFAVVRGGTLGFQINYNPFAIIVTGLPTSDPGVENQLWRSGNDVKISTG